MNKQYRRILILCLLGLSSVTVFVMSACGSNSDGPCQADYNCPADKPYCVGRSCVATLPGQNEPGPEAAAEPVVETPADAGETKDEAPPKDEAPSFIACSNAKDCPEATPWCRFGRCSEGYAFFDFLKGHPIMDPTQDAQTACQNSNQCKSWQTCVNGGSSTFCYTLAGRESTVKGKILDEGIFLSGRSFALIVLENAKEVVRMRMVGEFSDKLEQHLEIDVPSGLMNSSSTLDIEKDKIKVSLYNVKIEFVPPIRELVAVGTRGTVTLSQAYKSTSTRDASTLVKGSADIVFSKP
ncbi:MAG: hypothetical protein EP343_31315 [Deltaproteobacteria bacterium]|nr:MAG: hypothetical protein EP343_31315 [Deltaproteobacteria bacterium]